MKRALDMFGKQPAPRRVMMHVSDADGQCSDDGLSGWHCKMRCDKCGHETDWLTFSTASETKRGIPCIDCNKAEAEGPKT